MKKESLYLDTSVISAYYDLRDLAIYELTQTFWQSLPLYDVYVSEIVLDELTAIPDPALRQKFFDLIVEIKVLEITDKERALSNEYMKHGIIPPKYKDDALQLAVATTYEINYFISWNMEHLVKVKTRRMVNLINLEKGYRTVEIITPGEL